MIDRVAKTLSDNTRINHRLDCIAKEDARRKEFTDILHSIHQHEWIHYSTTKEILYSICEGCGVAKKGNV